MNTKDNTRRINTSEVEIGGIKVCQVLPDRATQDRCLVFVHGVFCDSRVFHLVMRGFAALGYQCYAPSLKGSTIARNVDMLMTFIKHLEQEVCLVCHSAGCVYGSEAAEQLPDAVMGCLYWMPPRRYPISEEASVLLPLYALNIGLGAIMDRTVTLRPNHAMSLMFNGSTTEQFAAMYSTLVPEKGGVLWGMLLSALTNRHVVKKLNVPVGVWGAKEDRMVSSSRELANNIGAPHYEVPGFHLGILGPSYRLLVEQGHLWLRQRVPDLEKVA